MACKKITKPYLHFIGKNSCDVTQSMTLVSFQSYTGLIDCGLFQSTNDEADYRINSKLPKDVKPKELDFIILTHSNHVDHSGAIPTLYKNGCTCNTYIPKGTKAILTLLLQDSASIMSKELEKYGRKPIYNQDDVDIALSHVIECELHERIKINDYISFEYYKAEHICRARQIYMELNDGINVKKIGFTGDISINNPSHYLNSFERLPQVDILVGENTYNSPSRTNKQGDREKDIEKLDTAIKNAQKVNGFVIVPTFSNTRLQEIMTVLYEMYDGDFPIDIFIDTPLGRNISYVYEDVIESDFDLWEKVKSWDKFTYIEGYQERFGLLCYDRPAIVLCSGGFLQNGTGVTWVKQCLDKTKNTIAFCGYSSTDSVASKIKSGELKHIKIDKRNVRNKANILIMNSFGSHMDYNQLIDYYTTVPYNKIALVHGDFDKKVKFSEVLKEELSKVNRSNRVICTTEGSKVRF